LLIRIDESLAMRDMVAADWHVKRKQPLSAIYLYRRVIQDYPQTAAAQDAVRELEQLGAEPLPAEARDAQNLDIEAVPVSQKKAPQAQEQAPADTKLTPSPTEVGESQPYELENEPLEPASTDEPALTEERESAAEPKPQTEQDDEETPTQPTPEKP